MIEDPAELIGGGLALVGLVDGVRRVALGDPERSSRLAVLADTVLAAHLAARRAGRSLVVVFADEADLAFLPLVGATWLLPDQPGTVPTPGHNAKVGLCGALSLEGSGW